MSSELAVRASGLGKCYPVFASPRERLGQLLASPIRRALGRREEDPAQSFWALRDVSFDVHRGETVGIIGSNGSGKSTLLQIICGTLTPSTGEVTTNGRIGALLELGSGFNPEFSGRENVLLNATILGLSRQDIEDRFDQIARFADIGDHLEQPVKSYSSGMAVRLAFAVQAHADPDILVVDEALAVGDARFQAKCFERLKQLRARGTSILLVTHSSDQIVNHCDRAILLNAGRMVEQGAPRQMINIYHDLLFGKPAHAALSDGADGLLESGPDGNHALSTTEDRFDQRPGYNPHEHRWGDGAARWVDFLMKAEEHAHAQVIHSGSKVRLEAVLRFHADVLHPIIGLTVKTHEGVTVYGTNSDKQAPCSDSRIWRAGECLRLTAEFECLLAPGEYFVSLGAASLQNGELVPHDRRYDAIHFSVHPDPGFFGLCNLKLGMTLSSV
ncbi:MAG: ABC transporter ATP-binding protein [Hydrogenophaga sp.]|nr:ABC transporter ATP-binding protein [Hydrogenophaga sp.]